MPLTEKQMPDIEYLWQSYYTKCYPDGASPEQYKQVRVAFIAGFATFLEINKFIGSDDCSEELGCTLLNFYSTNLEVELQKQNVETTGRTN